MKKAMNFISRYENKWDNSSELDRLRIADDYLASDPEFPSFTPLQKINLQDAVGDLRNEMEREAEFLANERIQYFHKKQEERQRKKDLRLRKKEEEKERVEEEKRLEKEKEKERIKDREEKVNLILLMFRLLNIKRW